MIKLLHLPHWCVDIQNVFFKGILLLGSLFMLANAAAQSLTISDAGQTGTSGTNWTTSGSNPVIISVTGTAGINTSVIAGYLNAGTSVVVDNATVGTTVNSNITKTAGGNASLTFKDISLIKVADNISITSTSNALNIIFWADSDNSQGGAVDDYIYCGAGSTFDSNGGKLVMAGGSDNGTNGGISGDGIPDGFAWNGSNTATYGANNVGGLTLGPRSGTGTVVSLSSNGGDIILRGATSTNNGYPGITSQGNLKIVSQTGKITLFGKSSLGHGIELTFGAVPAIAISSSSTSTPAIDIKGNTTMNGYTGFWASNNGTGNILIQSTAATGGGVSIEGVCTNDNGLILGNSGTSIISQVLSQSGTITLRGKGAANQSLVLYGDVYMGNRKDATAVQGVTPAVTASTANILLQGDDQFVFSNTAGKNANFNTTGALTVEAYTAGYTGTVSWAGNNIFGSGFSAITLGKSSENYSFTLNTSLTATGNITTYNSDFTLANGIGLASSGAGTIAINANGSFNTSGTTRRTISTVNGNINLYADADASGNGQLDIDYLTFNPGSGNTRVRTETMAWVTGANTDKPYFNGTGSVTIESADAAFQDVITSWFFFDQDANGMAGLTIGKATNTGNISHATPALSVAGPIAMYGGIVILSANLTSTATGDIFIKANTNRNSGAALDAAASILKTAGTGTLTLQSAARLNSGTITASGTGVLNVVLWSDYGNNNNGGVTIYGVTTNGGHLWLGGSNSNGGSYTWNGLTVGNGPSVGSVNNNYNAIDFYGPLSTSGGDVLVWGGDGYIAGSGISGMGVYSGAAINSGAGNITLIADNIALNDLTITSTGLLSLVPDGGSYPANITWSGSLTAGNLDVTGSFDKLIINNFANLGGLTIGYYNGQLSSSIPVVQGNSSNITTSSAISIAGPVTLYGTAVTVSQNLASTGARNISLYANTLSIAGGASLTSTGKLVIEPITAATTIGLTGGTGTLAVTTTNFNSNFTDGFSEIQIGNSAAGAITLAAAITAKDNLRLITSGNLNLNEIIDIGINNLVFAGNNIVPATNKFIKTNGTGTLIMDLANNVSKLFPLGITNYAPVTITNHTGATNTFYATASTGIYAAGGISGTSVPWSPRINITWNIGNTGASTGAGNVDLAFGWAAADVTGSLAAPRLLHHNGTMWTELPGTPTFDLVARTLTYTGYIGGFSPFAIAETNAVLPLAWLSFTGKKVQNTILLKWSTVAEQNNAGFDVERGSTGGSFTSIGRVAAGPQNAGLQNDYGYIDHKPLSGISYYRLKQVDLDGKSSYSTVLSFNIPNVQTYSITAMAGTKQLQLSIPQSATGKTELMMYDAGGRQVLRRQVQPGQTVIQTGFLTAGGIYVASVVQGSKLLYSYRFVN